MDTDSAHTEAEEVEQNLEPVNGHEVLAKLSELPVSTWRYLWESPPIRHLGPMAQDFYAAFGLGDSDRHIHQIDSSGVAFVAIQALCKRVQELEAQVDQLSKQHGSEGEGTTKTDE